MKQQALRCAGSCRPDGRLLLGLKGSISEFELGVLTSRMFDAARAKADRRQPRIGVPIAYIWLREIGLSFWIGT